MHFLQVRVKRGGDAKGRGGGSCERSGTSNLSLAWRKRGKRSFLAAAEKSEKKGPRKGGGKEGKGCE